MSNEIIPEEAAGWSSVLQELNIPKLVLGPAGEALSRLVGHVADVPAEYVKTFTQGIVDKREARTEVSRALSKAVASEVVHDRDLIHRAAQSFLAKELRTQANKEGVAKKAIRHLSGEPEASDPKPQTPEEDWLNVFERYAENASSETLRDVWGRILAKQIRKPRSFSLRTMRFIAELDFETALLFEKHSIGIINGSVISRSARLEGDKFVELLKLEDAGLVTGVSGEISNRYESDEPTTLLFEFPKSAVTVTCDGAISFSLRVVMLTNVAKELLTIIDPFDSFDTARAFAEALPRVPGIIRIECGSRIESDVVWERPRTEGKSDA